MENLNGLLDSGTVLNGAVISKLTVNGQVSIGRTFETIPIEDAEAGQIVQISEVDENGKPTAWAAIDIPKASDRVSYAEAQLLTDEQRELARTNIGADGYDWHELKYFPTDNAVGFAANLNTDNASVIDWSIASSMKSVKDENYTALYKLLGQVDVVTNGSQMSLQLPVIENSIIPEAEALLNSGCMSIGDDGILWNMYYCAQLGIRQKIVGLTIQMSSDGVWVFTGSNGMVMYYEGKLCTNTVKPTYDRTLTIKGTAADAKAVGDALADKLGRSEVPESIVQSVNGIAPDENGNVEVNALPDNTDQIEMLIEADMLPAVHDASGAILTDENGNIILRY